MKYSTWHWLLPKLLCLIIACGFWVYVMNEQNPLLENTYTVPVEVRNLDKSLVTANVPKTVKIHLRMARNEMIGLQTGTIKAYVDAANLEPGEYPETPIHVDVPGNETILSMTPSHIPLRIDTYSVRTLPIQLQTVGILPAGKILGEVKVSPNQVTIAGASDRVFAVERAVASVKLAGHEQSFETFGDLVLFEHDGNAITGLDIMPSQVKVTIPIQGEQKTATLPVKPVMGGTVAPGYRIEKVEVEPSTVDVQASAKYFDEHKAIETEEIQVSDWTETTEKTVPLVKPKDGTSTPPTVTVTVEVGKE